MWMSQRQTSPCFLAIKVAAAIGRHEIEHRVAGVAGLAIEIHPSIDLPQHAAREDADHDMRRLRLAIRTRDRAGLHRIELEHAFLVASRTAEAFERRVRQPAAAGLVE